MTGTPSSRLVADPRRSIPLAASLVLVLATGCGSDSSRHDVSGTVSFRGQPVPTGEISFEPDVSRGNTGPQSRAAIEDGRFETLPGKGPVPGPTRVRVTGYAFPDKGRATDMTAWFPLPIFAPHELEIDLPNEGTTIDIVIPAVGDGQPATAANP